MEKFLEILVEVLDAEEVITMDSVLADIEEWDSLSVVSFAAMADVEYSKKLTAPEIRKAKTVRDLYHLIVGE